MYELGNRNLGISAMQSRGNVGNFQCLEDDHFWEFLEFKSETAVFRLWHITISVADGVDEDWGFCPHIAVASYISGTVDAVVSVFLNAFKLLRPIRLCRFLVVCTKIIWDLIL